VPIRIAFLSSWTLAPEKGSGTAMAITGLAGGLESLGCDVDLVGTARVLPWPGRRLPSRLLYNLLLPLHVDPSRYDAVVGLDLDGCLLGRRLFEGSGAGTVHAISLKGVAADERRFETGLPRATFALLAALEGRNARRADRVLVTSEHCLRRAAEAYRVPPERFRIVPEGIDLDAWERLRSRLPAEPERPATARRGCTLLNVARQYRRKDTRTLLDALPTVLREHPETRLRVVGGGPELPALRRRARELALEDRVTFLGELPGQDSVRREYLSADLFCLPSRQEGFGIALLEAMAAGLPIVAADAAAIPEVAPHGETGLLVPPGDPAALAGAIVRLLGDRDLRARCAAAGRARVARYAWPGVARRFLDALDLEPSEPT